MGNYDARLDCWITVCELPPHVKGMVTEKDGDIIILINEALSERAKIRALIHEVRHLKRRDMRSEKSITAIERE